MLHGLRADFRLNNSSQLVSFAKAKDLPCFLDSSSAEHRYEPTLAPTKELLDACQTQPVDLQPVAVPIVAQRIESELRHGARPFATEQELDASHDAVPERLAEPAAERILRWNRAFGREL